MNRARVGVGVVAVASGTAWALGGTNSLVTVVRAFAGLLPLLLVIGGVSVILFVVVPRGMLAGPVLLVSIGVLALAVEHGVFRRSLFIHVPAFIIIGAGVVVAMSQPRDFQIGATVKRYTTILLPVRHRVIGSASPKIVVRAIFGMVLVDLSKADYPKGVGRLSVDLTCIMGRIEIVVPRGWRVLAGRVDLARGMSFEGTLTDSELAPLKEQEAEHGKKLVALNIQGWGGAVVVERS